MKQALVFGAGGLIGSHLVKRLKLLGYWVRAVDIKYPEFSASPADQYFLADLTNYEELVNVLYDKRFDEIYQLAADMGGAEYIFTGDNDTNIMTNSVQINLNLIKALVSTKQLDTKIFYSSSACVYPEEAQLDKEVVNLIESSAYPANPDSEYGWEKIFSERLYTTFSKNYDVEIRIARFHNVFGPEGTWQGGKEKAPAAICRKVAMAEQDGEIEILGDGEQLRSFLYIDDALDGVMALMRSDCTKPVNIGSDLPVTINQLVDIVQRIPGKKLNKKHISGPTGVVARNSENTFVFEQTGWRPNTPLADGLVKTFWWISEQITKKSSFPQSF